ncbi:MAG: zinc ribbon domain-containing protein [Nitrosomonas sp. PRO4]|nr:zinc ribbon domain-containing protein [Nitrosomonas sp. PRO4]
MICPKCGTENTDHAEFCINCQESLPQQTRVHAESGEQKNAEQNTFHDNSPTQVFSADDNKSTFESTNEKPPVSPGLNIAIIVGTILFPIVGIAMGYTYYRRDNPDAKKTGKNWLILGCVMFLVNILLVNLMK